MQEETTARLEDFVAASKEKGASDEFLANVLTRRGWPADAVYAALGRYWEGITGISIPERGRSGESARDGFLYLLSFATLATWTTALGAMIFDFINRWLPDAVSRSNVFNLRSTLSWEMARLAVAFPIYLLVTRLTLREAIGHPERLDSGVRKWLTYLALLGTAGTMICDLIWFLDYLLGGEITLRFVLKSITVLIIAAAIFSYYLGSLKWNSKTNASRAKFQTLLFGGGSAIAVIVTFCIGIAVAGTPAQQRQVEADEKRVQDLHALAAGIRAWHDQAPVLHPNATIPASLPQLARDGRFPVTRISDPETHVTYEFHPRGGTRYELCANFSSNAPDDRSTPLGYHSDFWRYGKGQTCFVLDASQNVPY
jgi:uncharacterized membrane protein YidH (DUF202 family)